MAIEFAPTALVPTKSAPSAPPVPFAPRCVEKPSMAQNMAADKVDKSDKGDKESRNFQEDLDAAKDEPDADAAPTDASRALKKAQAAAKSSATGPTSADASTWMAAYLPQAPVPAAVPSSPAATDVPQGNGALADLKSDAAGLAGTAVAAGNAALSSVVTDAKAQSASFANYASVFEQIQSRLAAGGKGMQDVTGQGAKGLAKPVLGTATADARADQLAAVTSSGVWTMPVTEPSALQAVTDATEAMQLAVRETSNKREGLGVEKAPEGGVSHGQFTPTVHFDSAAASVDASQPAPEAAVADQVSYWVSQGIQNAELTFDGADAQPVQVSISLSGNEAHVVFRTDQLETRDLLTGSAAHLKDLLQSQGMVLSGLSVGSSGAGGTDARERRAPSEGRQNTGRSAPEVAAVRPTTPQGNSGRALDLFV